MVSVLDSERFVIGTVVEPCGEDYLNTWVTQLVLEYNHYGSSLVIETYEHCELGEPQPRKPWADFPIDKENAERLCAAIAKVN